MRYSSERALLNVPWSAVFTSTSARLIALRRSRDCLRTVSVYYVLSRTRCKVLAAPPARPALRNLHTAFSLVSIQFDPAITSFTSITNLRKLLSLYAKFVSRCVKSHSAVHLYLHLHLHLHPLLLLHLHLHLHLHSASTYTVTFDFTGSCLRRSFCQASSSLITIRPVHRVVELRQPHSTVG